MGYIVLGFFYHDFISDHKTQNPTNLFSMLTYAN